MVHILYRFQNYLTFLLLYNTFKKVYNLKLLYHDFTMFHSIKYA